MACAGIWRLRPQPSALQLPNGISVYFVAHLKDICNNCCLLAPQDTAHHCPNELNNNNQRFNKSKQASTINHGFNCWGNLVTHFSTRQETVINHGAGKNHHGEHNRHSLNNSRNDSYVEEVQIGSGNRVTEMQSYKRQVHRNSISDASTHVQAFELELAGAENAAINTN
jgi:hypothetical protein